MLGVPIGQRLVRFPYRLLRCVVRSHDLHAGLPDRCSPCVGIDSKENASVRSVRLALIAGDPIRAKAPNGPGRWQ